MLTKCETIFDGKLTLGVPEDFVELSEQEIGEYYRNEKPSKVFANKDKGAILSASLLEQTLEVENVEKRIQEYAVLYQRSIPNFANCKIAKRPLDNGTYIGIFHYTSTTVDKNLFNYIVLACVDGKEALITMHCDINDCPAYAEKFMKAINSICVNE